MGGDRSRRSALSRRREPRGPANSWPFRHAGHRIKVIGDMACATFTETMWHVSDVDRTTPWRLLEHRVLERHDGRWKITHLIFVPVRNTAHDRAHIRVDASGRVAHVSPAMKAALADSGLTISAGRLRAVRPRWDRELQAASPADAWIDGFSELGTAFIEGEFLDRAAPASFRSCSARTSEAGSATAWSWSRMARSSSPSIVRPASAAVCNSPTSSTASRSPVAAGARDSGWACPPGGSGEASGSARTRLAPISTGYSKRRVSATRRRWCAVY